MALLSDRQIVALSKLFVAVLLVVGVPASVAGALSGEMTLITAVATVLVIVAVAVGVFADSFESVRTQVALAVALVLFYGVRLVDAATIGRITPTLVLSSVMVALGAVWAVGAGLSARGGRRER